ncbi:MAG TPA: glycoside hydrolase family 88 protein [Bryobacteraceae bacterium]|nr:glycoside hydrolase family 88 protein [Bryobacteraceae bacterium]
MRSGDELRFVAAQAADRLLSHSWKLWFWGDSIGLDGLLDATDVTGDSKYLGFVYGLLKAWIARERQRSEFDYTAAGVALLRVYERTGDEALLAAARRHADYLASFRRTTAGAYVRYESAAIELPPELPPGIQAAPAAGKERAANGGPCVFVDCVHFDGPFFAKMYQVTGEEQYRVLAAANIIPQVDLLYDPAERLFHHFWMERTGRPNGVLWARGNGWGLLGVAQTLEGIGMDGAAGARLAPVLRDGIERLASLQDAGGAWHTILNDPQSYVEASTAPFYADIIARAIRLGVVRASDYDTVLEAAMSYMVSHVRPDGVLAGVSYETFPSTRAAHYREMPRGAVVPWGQGPLLTAIRSYLELHAAVPAAVER